MLHSFDRLTSLFLHALAPLTLHVIRFSSFNCNLVWFLSYFVFIDLSDVTMVGQNYMLVLMLMIWCWGRFKDYLMIWNDSVTWVSCWRCVYIYPSICICMYICQDGARIGLAQHSLAFGTQQSFRLYSISPGRCLLPSQVLPLYIC